MFYASGRKTDIRTGGEKRNEGTFQVKWEGKKERGRAGAERWPESNSYRANRRRGKKSQMYQFIPSRIKKLGLGWKTTHLSRPGDVLEKGEIS